MAQMAKSEEVLFAREQEVDDYTEQLPEISTEKYLIFSSDNLMYGIKAEQVNDIITDYTITYLPKVPNYVRGVINLRGQIIPVVDIRLRLGKPEQSSSSMVFPRAPSCPSPPATARPWSPACAPCPTATPCWNWTVSCCSTTDFTT